MIIILPDAEFDPAYYDSDNDRTQALIAEIRNEVSGRYIVVVAIVLKITHKSNQFQFQFFYFCEQEYGWDYVI